MRNLSSLFVLFFTSIIGFSQTGNQFVGELINDKKKPVKNAIIVVQGQSNSYISDAKGKFILSNLPENKKLKASITHESHYSKIIEFQLAKGEKVVQKINLVQRELDEVVVKYNSKDEKREQVSITKIDPRQTENLPSVFGDFNKVLATLPGVNSNSELSSTYSVRGGNYDENLVYVNGIPIYRPFIVSAGQQEGLSFVNAALVRDVEFSAGGWQPRYGDKLSSVLAVEYKTPSKFGGSVTASALGGGFHLEGSNKDQRVTYVAGLRYKDSRWVLRNTDLSEANFRPWFIDYQSYLNFDLTNREKNPDEIKTTLGLLTSYARNSFYVAPTARETNFGSFQIPKRLTIAFDGSETMSYDALQNGLKLDHKFTSNLKANFIISNLYTLEREFFDVDAGMKLCDVSSDPNSDINKCVFTQDIGKYYRHGRNELEAEIYNLQSNWEYALSDNSVFEWGAIYSNENIVDVVDEYTFIDSADYVDDLRNLEADLNLKSSRAGVFAQHTLKIDSNKVFTYGARASFWDVNQQFTFSPRAQFSVKPKWKRDVVLNSAIGVYHQPPFYRELRDSLGVLNKNLRAQMSVHIISGLDYNYKWWNRNFKFTGELYYKHIKNAIVYDIQDVKIRYRALNDAAAYAYGADFRVSGEFIKGSESWFSLGLLRTREKLDDDSFVGVDGQVRNAGYIPRPTDQLVTIGVFFQDHLPGNPTWRMYLNGIYGSGLPFNIPGVTKQNGYDYYNEQFDQTYRISSMGRMPSYKRVDIGISKIFAINVDEEIETKGIRSVWVGIEALNVLANNNVISYTWVDDLYGTKYAIPNYLSRRMVNLKVIVKF